MIDKPLFLDTSFIIALYNRDDQFHDAARRAAQEARGRLQVTTEAVLLEVGSAFSKVRHRAAGARIIRAALAGKGTRVIPLTRTLLKRGLQLFEERPDKEWSLVDCISFEVMKQERIDEALAVDEHFVQAGFVAFPLARDMS